MHNVLSVRMPPEPLVMNTKFRSRNVVIGALRARYTLKPCCILAQSQLSTYDSPASMRMLRDFAAPMSTLSPRDIRYSHVMDVSASGTSWLGDFNSDIGERRVSWAEAVFSPRPASVFLFRCSREKLSGTGWTHAASPQKAVRGDKYRDLHRALTALGFSNSALCAR